MHVVERIVLGKEKESKWDVLFLFFFFVLQMIFWKVVFDHLKGLFTQNCFIVYSSSCPNLTFFCETHIKIFGRMLGTKEFLWPLNWKTCLCSTEESQCFPYNDVTSWLTTIYCDASMEKLTSYSWLFAEIVAWLHLCCLNHVSSTM